MTDVDQLFSDSPEEAAFSNFVNKLEASTAPTAVRGEFTLVPRGIGPFRDKYRPQKIEEIVPTCSVEQLVNQIGNPSASQVYLFEGNTGTGKTTCARILAKAANCLAGNASERPCLKCKCCSSFENSYDKVEINTANQNKIDDVRNLVADMRYAPAIYNKKIYIMDEVQRLTADAQQVLLTELEEPYSYLLVFLCTTNIKKIDKALVDRACRITFSALTPRQASLITQQIFKHEGLSGDDDLIESLYQQSDGSVRALLNNIEAYKDKGFNPDSWEEDEAPAEVKSLFQVINKGDWVGLSKILKRPNVRKEPESLRIGLESYIRGVMLRQASIADATKYGTALMRLEGTLMNEPSVSQYNGFVLKCLRACALFKQ